MADTNVLKILRNSQLFATREEALANIDSRAATLGDGEVWIATYGTTSSDAKSILAIKRQFSNGTTCVTKFDLDAISGEIEGDLYKYKMVALTAEEISALSDPNVKEAYKVVAFQGEETEQTVYTQVGDIVKIYKDSSLIESYLGSDADSVDATTGAVTKYAYELISDPTRKITADAYEELTAEQKALYQEINSQSLNFVYQLANGTYTLTKVDVSKFLVESEFGNGLQVNGSGVVSVKVDGTSENFISVGENGVKISGIQDAINASINNSEIVTAAALNDLEDRKADKTDLKTLEGNVLAKVNAGNGIDVTTKANSEQTVSVKLNTTATDNALSLDTNGLYFSKSIDCGTY